MVGLKLCTVYLTPDSAEVEMQRQHVQTERPGSHVHARLMAQSDPTQHVVDGKCTDAFNVLCSSVVFASGEQLVAGPATGGSLIPISLQARAPMGTHSCSISITGLGMLARKFLRTSSMTT